MTPVTRLELYLSTLAGGAGTAPSPITREEMYLAKACGLSVTVPDPITCREEYLYKISGGTITLQSPITRLEQFMAAAAGMAVTPPTPITREEWFWYQLSNGQNTITGVPPITFTSDGSALTSYSVTGNMTQTGTPTPAQPIVPEETGDRTGNLAFKTIQYVNIIADGTIGADSGYKIAVAKVTQGQVYSGRGYVYAFFASEPSKGSVSYNGERVVDTCIGVTAPIDGYLAIRSESSAGDQMINTGSAILPYEPYGYAIPLSCAGTTYPIYLQEPLRKIGDYADVVDSSGTVTRKIKRLVLYGTENWTLDTSGVRSFKTTVSSAAQSGTSALSSHFDGVTVTGTTLTIPDADSTFADEAALNTFLTSADAAVWYVLATATTETVTCPTITPASGSNTLSIGTTLAPSGVSITGHIS